MRLLDVGCGWGSLSLHAAEHFGAQVTGVTIAAEQKRFIDARIAERGLRTGSRSGCRTTARCPSATADYDAVGSIEMGEHVGEEQLPDVRRGAARAVKPGGRVLVQQMSRTGRGTRAAGRSSSRFIAPDMHMRPVGETVAYLEAGGSRCATCTPCASTTCAPSTGWLEQLRGQPRRG